MGYRVAVVGATGNVGREMLNILAERQFPADEVAAILGTTTVAVNSALLRARDRIAREAPDPDGMTEPSSPAIRNHLLRYVDAWSRADVGALAAVLREDVTLEMPPYATWFAGRRPVLGFLGAHVLRDRSPFAVLPVSPSANAQPTLATYAREPDGSHAAHALQVLEVLPDGVRRIDVFLQPDLFPIFRQPVSLPPGPDLPG